MVIYEKTGYYFRNEVISLDQIIHYIEQKYSPLSIILYGSYANGTNNSGSDFDALVISSNHKHFHDTSFVSDIQLDVFVYPASYFESDFDLNDFIQISDSRILKDHDGLGKRLKEKVVFHLQNRLPKSETEIDASIDWCVKMLERTKRADAEGLFRWHWVLTDSLEIFCDVMGHPYLGPKKSLKWMEENHPDAFACYQQALSDFKIDSLAQWVAYIKHKKDTL